MKPKKATTVRIRPFEGDEETARIISERTGLSMIDVMSLALQAGLNAIKNDDYRLELPIQLKKVPVSERKDRPREAESEVGGSVAFSSETPTTYKTAGRNKPKS
jgi:hypothetical protein